MGRCLVASVRFVVIEDERAIRRFLCASTEPSEAEWHEAETGQAGLRLIAQKNPDIVLLDLGLPDMDGLEVLRNLREWSEVPVIVLSARGKENDKILALDSGADDYLTKPFSVGELMARVRVALKHRKRSDAPAASTFAAADLFMDFAGHSVTVGGLDAKLTLIEFRLLSMLVQNSGRVITHRHMLSEIWGPQFEDSTHTLRVHMANLRQKLSGSAAKKMIQTETGVGYRFVEPVE